VAGDLPPDSALLTRIGEMNALDLELYAHATRVLGARLAAARDPEFATRLARLRQRNARRTSLAPLWGLLPATRRAFQRAGLLK
jgi:hypothetical protein